MPARRLARRTFGVLALFVGIMAGLHIQQGVAASQMGAATWHHYLLATLYLIGAAGLVARPRGFVLYFCLLTLYAVGATLVDAWRAVRGAEPFSVDLAFGFVIFPIALNLLLADEIHERTVATTRPVIRGRGPGSGSVSGSWAP